MRLQKFYVKNYRSIVEAELKDIGKYCVIVGPNNSGKSNMLRALVVAIYTAQEGSYRNLRRRKQYSYIYQGESYNWIRDIPKSLSNDDTASTIFKLTFEFTEQEKSDFYSRFGIHLSKSLQVKFQLFKNATEYNIIMPGRAKAPMESRMQEIGQFIRDKLDPQYIPCVRTTELSSDVFFRLIEREMESLYKNEEYSMCIQRAKDMQRPVIESLEQRLTDILRTFVPSIRKVRIPIYYESIDAMRIAPIWSRRSSPIEIDDGTETLLDEKGDGIKSLVAIGLMQSASLDIDQSKSLVLCIEEPESHLHPDAIHSLKGIISDMSYRDNIQVIITTHSPILVDIDNPSNNVLVDDTYRVRPCLSITDLRELLGVRLRDNLIGEQKVILVEGESDRRYLVKFLSEKYELFSRRYENHEIEIVNVRGASRAGHYVRMYNSMIIPTLVIFDNDDAGIASRSELIGTHLKSECESLVIKSIGMQRNEIEDIINPDVYIKKLEDDFNIRIDTRRFNNRRKKWSDRIKIEMNRCPIPWSDELLDQLKTTVTDIVVEKGLSSVSQHDLENVDILLSSIARFLCL